MVSRGDIWLADVAGSAAPAQRCVIVSPPELHDHLGAVVVAPLAADAPAAAFRVAAMVDGAPAMLCLERLRTISLRRLQRKTGTLDRKTMAAALGVLREMFSD